jgi:hypothetical protein
MTEMQNRGLAVLRNGYPLIPTVPQEKRPAIGGWRTIKATETLVKGWGGAGCGIGIRTGNIVFIDGDILNAVSDRVRALCERTLGWAPMRTGKAPKFGLMYRTETAFKTSFSRVYEDRDGNRCAIEMLADGRQFVAYGIHPDTRQPYYWRDDRGPDTIPVDALTLVTEEQILQLRDLFDRIAQEEGWTLLGGGSTTPGRADAINPDADRMPLGLSDEDIMQKVGMIPNDDRFDARDDWLLIGFAIHHETGGSEFGREVFYEWSTQHPSHGEDAFRKAWDSMGTRYGQPNDAAVTFRYILKILKEQRQAALAATLLRIDSDIGTASSIDALTKLAFEISGLDGLEDIRREILAAQLQNASKRLGTKLSIVAIRRMLKPPTRETEMPDWLKDWVFLKETDQFYNISTTEYVGPNAFNRAFGRYVKDIPASRFATDLAKLPVHHMTAYLPGKGPVWVDPLEQSWVNTYRDTAPAIPAQYTERDLAAIETVKRHARHLFGDKAERDIALLHSALAYIVQTQKRINWMIVLQGAEAVGKTFYAHLLREVLGGEPHVHELTTETLTESSFTSWAEGHLVAYVEELKLHGKRYDVLNKMKSYISNEYVTVHAKYRAPRNVLNTASYFAFTNHRDALPLDDGDTRYFLMLSQWQNADEVKQFKAANPRYYERLWQTLEDSPGALRRWLLEYDLHPEFSPVNRAPSSSGREIVLRESKPELQQDIEDLIQDGRYPWISDDLVVVHLLREALGDAGMLPSADDVRRILRRMQFTPATAGRIGFGGRGTQKFFYCWSRNRDVVSASADRLRELIEAAVASQL